MNFPYEPIDVFHRHGGQITKVNRIEHEHGKPRKTRDGQSRDRWFFRCDVEWSDGTASKDTEVQPILLCYENDAGEREVRVLLARIAAYLKENGKWVADEVDGQVIQKGWVAT